MNSYKKITLSIISHDQAKLVQSLLNDIQKYSEAVEVVLTLNANEMLPFAIEHYSFPIKIIKNSTPKGFGENHNAALAQCNTDFFCVLNPDIHLLNNPFDVLLQNFDDPHVGIVAPRIEDSFGVVQDNVRKFPTLWSVIKRILLNKRIADYPINHTVMDVDWVAGMFIVFRAQAFKQVGGFDARFFLYYEDVDICARLHTLNYRVLFDSRVMVIHNAQRASHKNLRYLRWHLTSLVRYFSKN